MNREEKIENEIVQLAEKALSENKLDYIAKFYLILRLVLDCALTKGEAERILSEHISEKNLQSIDEHVYQTLYPKIKAIEEG